MDYSILEIPSSKNMLARPLWVHKKVIKEVLCGVGLISCRAFRLLDQIHVTNQQC